MSLDLFAIGHAITIPFMHEQVWFDVGYRTVRSHVNVDVFITNDSRTPIDQLRVQLPHFVALDEIEVLSNPSVFTEEAAFHANPHNWIGKFRVNHDRRRIELLMDFGYDVTEDAQPFDAIPLSGSFPPNGFLPAVATNSAKYQQAMQELDRAVVVFDLDTPLPAREKGWLRLKLPAKDWPRDEEIVALRGTWYTDEPTTFISRGSVLSPTHLRQDLLSLLSQPQNKAWHNDVVAHGWNEPGTLSRVEDHRVSIVFPQSADVSHVSSIPDGAFWAAGPIALPTDSTRCVLHFASGSRLNEHRDVVTLARRICDYCHYLTEDRKVPERSPGIDLLITRFGSSSHEAIGTLIDQMIECGMLEWTRRDTRTVMAAPKDQLPARMLDLRQRYTFPASNGSFLGAFKELHPFRISFRLGWTALSARQEKQAQMLRKFLGALEGDGHRANVERRALVVSCSDGKNAGLDDVPQVRAIASRLTEELEHKTAVRARHLHNPVNRAELMDAVRQQLNADPSLLVFWYLGHAVQSKDLERLQLTGPTHETVEWRDIVELFSEHRAIPKILLLDCCHAGLGVRQAAHLDNCLIWGTTDANHGAQSGGFLGNPDAANKYPNFTSLAASMLENHRDHTPLEFEEWFKEAQSDAIGNTDAAAHRIYGTEALPLAVDPTFIRRNTAAQWMDDIRASLEMA